MAIHEFIGVYHADGGLRGEVRYVVGHLLGRTECALCDITHSPIRRKKQWDGFVADLGVPFRLLHLNEMPPDVASAVSRVGSPSCSPGPRAACRFCFRRANWPGSTVRSTHSRRHWPPLQPRSRCECSLALASVDPIRRTETWFSRNGFPQFVDGYNSAEHIWTRALPAMAVVAAVQLVSALSLAVTNGTRLVPVLVLVVPGLVLVSLGFLVEVAARVLVRPCGSRGLAHPCGLPGSGGGG